MCGQGGELRMISPSNKNMGQAREKKIPPPLLFKEKLVSLLKYTQLNGTEEQLGYEDQ